MSSERDRGLVHLNSPYTVADTIARLEEIVRSKRITVLAQIDHGGDAARAGLRMNPTQLLWECEGWHADDDCLAFRSH